MNDTTETMTNTMISTLRDEANTAGDVSLVEACKAALLGNTAARCKCAGAINSARAMDDSKPFVRVTIN
jgi:hypothetical protein